MNLGTTTAGLEIFTQKIPGIGLWLKIFGREECTYKSEAQ